MMRSLPFMLVAALATTAQGQIFQPTSAIAGSEFSSLYDIGNTIDGSGLPAGFTPDSVHATYVANNHWTTQAGALGLGRAWAQFFFDEPVRIGVFHMWNHLSNGVAADSGYAVTLFNLELLDSNDNVLYTLANAMAQPHVSVAQSYFLPVTNNVSSVKFTILANNGSNNYTGLAEVAFGAVPTPGAAALLGVAGLLAGRRRR
ncbi:MAG: hypothetical protein KF912_09430 [Phycisphaeraceae bacterium]|nr:hypothetical protein [Phycisphaeraceae bacterium]MBX3367515.1 hypothetical protein [Phycisphaeraceae bacterium]QYK47008.1 MAG: hypothetical protein KF838_09445 [Phycisphaeraceae bacterium]